jgi:nucleoside 2-deoxyribosyltransferase
MTTFSEELYQYYLELCILNNIQPLLPSSNKWLMEMYELEQTNKEIDEEDISTIIIDL